MPGDGGWWYLSSAARRLRGRSLDAGWRISRWAIWEWGSDLVWIHIWFYDINVWLIEHDSAWLLPIHASTLLDGNQINETCRHQFFTDGHMYILQLRNATSFMVESILIYDCSSLTHPRQHLTWLQKISSNELDHVKSLVPVWGPQGKHLWREQAANVVSSTVGQYGAGQWSVLQWRVKGFLEK